VVCQSAGFIGALITAPAIPTWYEELIQPSFRPPNWVFAPVWTTLYLLMGISMFLVWRKAETSILRRNAVAAFVLQLALNMSWSIAFFGFRSPLGGMIVIVLLLAAIIAMTGIFYRISRPAAYLQIPYVLWVSFASILNLSIFILNK